MNRSWTALFLAFLLLVIAPPRSDAQSWGSGLGELTRAELTDLLARLDQQASSSSVSGNLRTEAREEAERVRTRLTAGDFRVGDQIQLMVEGEDALTNTFVVRPGEVLALPGVDEVSLAGVLRSELQEHLTTHLAKYLRRPVVTATSLMRLTISGAVTNPGFLAVDADRPLSDAIMTAGGPLVGADINAIYIERGGERIWKGAYLQQAIADGRTLDQLSLQAGDQIFVPMRRAPISSTLVSVGLGVLSATALIVTILSR